MEHDDPRLQKALARYQVISALIASPPPRGQRGQVRSELAARTWIGADGEPFSVTAETIRAWERRYRRGGLEALLDKERPRRGVEALSPEVIEKACALKREVPERTLDRIIRILEELEMVPTGLVRRSTLHRALRARGLSRRAPVTDRQDLDRFEAEAPNDLWQSDMLVGPWLPDPERPGSSRRAYLFAFVDDHSRLCLDGRFSFKGDLPALELSFRRSLQKWGIPKKVYYDNGQVYRSNHMKQIVGYLGIHRLIFTKPHRPMGHGKIEAFNRLVRGGFFSELKASRIQTLDELNEAFRAWLKADYIDRVHSETGEAPLARWRAGIDDVRYADEEALRLAFLWREDRTADKTGVFSMFGVRYQVGPTLAKRRFQVRYDPETLHEVEIWRDGSFVQRAKPLQVQAQRRPKPAATPAPTKPSPTADWLGHLVAKHREEGVSEPDPKVWKDEAHARREQNLTGLLALLEERLDPHVLDVPEVRAFAARFGPFDLERAEADLDAFLARHPADLHVRLYLDLVHGAGVA